MHPLSISPHQDAANYSEAELRSDIDFDSRTSKLVNANGAPQRPRSTYVTETGGGTLVVLTDAGNERHFHGLEADQYVNPDPLVLQKLLAESTAFAASAVLMVDDTASPVYVDDTTDFNDAGAADVLIMPATEAANVDGLLIGYTEPFNAFETTLSTAGVGGTMQGSVYTGNPDATLDYANFTAVTIYGAGANATASGDVYWDAPVETWRPVTINSLGPYYWFFWAVLTTFSTNPVLSQGQLKHRTNVGGIRVGV